MSSPSLNAGLVPKLSLPELAKKIKDNNPNLKDDDDVHVALLYLKKFPDQVSLLSPNEIPIAKKAIEANNVEGVKDFYKRFGRNTLEGVSLDQAPNFVKPVLKSAGTKLIFGDEFNKQGGGAGSVAHVYGGSPGRIYIDRPDLMDKPTLAHESVHVYQGALKEPMKPDAGEERGEEANYDYGGWQGLIDAQAKHKSIRDFTDEQQAEMVGDYVRLQEALSDPTYRQKDASYRKVLLDEWDQANRAIAPYLRQLSGQPKQGESEGNIFHLGSIDTKPAAPAAPPASVSGFATPLEAIGGKAVFFDPKSLVIHQGLVPKAKGVKADPKVLQEQAAALQKRFKPTGAGQ